MRLTISRFIPVSREQLKKELDVLAAEVSDLSIAVFELESMLRGAGRKARVGKKVAAKKKAAVKKAVPAKAVAKKKRGPKAVAKKRVPKAQTWNDFLGEPKKRGRKPKAV